MASSELPYNLQECFYPVITTQSFTDHKVMSISSDKKYRYLKNNLTSEKSILACFTFIKPGLGP